jgi:hypothetical protein
MPPSRRRAARVPKPWASSSTARQFRSTIGDSSAAPCAIEARKSDGLLLLAAWNIRGFDSNKFGWGPRLPEAFYFLAEMIASFDLVAIQAVNEDLEPFRQLMRMLGASGPHRYGRHGGTGQQRQAHGLRPQRRDSMVPRSRDDAGVEEQGLQGAGRDRRRKGAPDGRPLLRPDRRSGEGRAVYGRRRGMVPLFDDVFRDEDLAAYAA